MEDVHKLVATVECVYAHGIPWSVAHLRLMRKIVHHWRDGRGCQPAFETAGTVSNGYAGHVQVQRRSQHHACTVTLDVKGDDLTGMTLDELDRSYSDDAGRATIRRGGRQPTCPTLLAEED